MTVRRMSSWRGRRARRGVLLGRRRLAAHAYSISSCRTAFCTKRPRRVSATDSPSAAQEPAASQPLERLRPVGRAGPGERQRAVQPQAQHPPLAPPVVGVQALLGAGRLRAGRRGRDVAGQARRVAPAAARDRADGTDPDPEVVGRVPVGQAVAALVAGPGEVGRLVPAVAGLLETLHDAVVRVRRLVLVGRRRAVARQRRARLELELVPGQVVRAQREGVGHVGLEVGGRLARAPRTAGRCRCPRTPRPGRSPKASRDCSGVAARSSAPSRWGRNDCTPSDSRVTPMRAQLATAPGGRPSRGSPRW